MDLPVRLPRESPSGKIQTRYFPPRREISEKGISPLLLQGSLLSTTMDHCNHDLAAAVIWAIRGAWELRRTTFLHFDRHSRWLGIVRQLSSLSSFFVYSIKAGKRRKLSELSYIHCWDAGVPLLRNKATQTFLCQRFIVRFVLAGTRVLPCHVMICIQKDGHCPGWICRYFRGSRWAGKLKPDISRPGGKYRKKVFRLFSSKALYLARQWIIYLFIYLFIDMFYKDCQIVQMD